LVWNYRSKYKNKRTELAGYSFASKGESGLFLFLKAMEQGGEISELRTQETVYLSRARIIYKPDFSFLKDGIKEYAEYKGFETPEWRIKRRLWMSYGPGTLYIYKGNCNLHETLTPEINSDEPIQTSNK
jgi:predicted nuclease of restriction endonuclease-like RecB superfamily